MGREGEREGETGGGGREGREGEREGQTDIRICNTADRNRLREKGTDRRDRDKSWDRQTGQTD